MSLPPRCWLLLVLASPAFAAAPPELPRDRRGEPLPRGAVARLGTVSFLHAEQVGLSAFSPDSRKLAVLTGRTGAHSLCIWDIAQGKMEHRLPLAQAGVTGLCWTADGKSIAISDHEEVRLVSPTTGKTLRRFASPDQSVTCLALSRDGRFLAVGCQARKLTEKSVVLVWNLTTGKQLPKLQGHAAAVADVTFSADGKTLFSWNRPATGGLPPALPPPPGAAMSDKAVPGAICVWDIPSGKLRKQRKHDAWQVAFAPDGKTLASMGENKLHLVDLGSGKEIATLAQPRVSFLYLPDGKTLATGSNEQMITLWDAHTGKKLRQFIGNPQRGVWLASVSPDGKRLATLFEWLVANGNNNRVRVWDVAAGKELQPDEGHHDFVTCLALTPDDKTLISGSDDRTLRVWDVGSGKQLRIYSGHRQPITAVALSPDGRTVASGDSGNAVHVWDRATGKRLHQFPPTPADRPQTRWDGIRSLRFRPDGKAVIAASAVWVEPSLAGRVWLLDLVTGKRGKILRRENGVAVALAPGGNNAVVVGALSTNFASPIPPEAHWTSLLSGNTLVRIEETRAAAFNRVLVSADSKTLIIDSSSSPPGPKSEPQSVMYETATGRKICEFAPPRRGHAAGDSLAFSPDGTMVAVGETWGSSVKLVSSDTGQATVRLDGHLGPVTCGTFSLDGRFLVSGSMDQTILVWDLTRTGSRRSAEIVDTRRASLEKLCADLAGRDTARAYKAIRQLAAVPGHSVPLLRARLKPVPQVHAAKIDQAIKDLDSELFAVREQAFANLEKLEDLAAPALRRVLNDSPSLEAHRRAERLLLQLEKNLQTPQRLRVLRGTTVLERAATPEARRLLADLAKGAAGALITEEAKAALQRLSLRLDKKHTRGRESKRSSLAVPGRTLR